MLFPPQTFARQRQTCNGKPLRSIDFNTIARENTNYNCLQFIVIKGRAHSQNCSSFCIFSSNDSETTKPGLQIGYPKAADAVRINTRQDYCGSHFSSSVLSDFILVAKVAAYDLLDMDQMEEWSLTPRKDRVCGLLSRQIPLMCFPTADCTPVKAAKYYN